MLWFDLLIVATIIYAAYVGVRRGAILIALELLSFTLATAVALFSYQPLGSWLKPAASFTTAMANVAAFMLIWIFSELLAAIVIRYVVLPRLPRDFHFTTLSQIGGSALNALKTLIIITVGLIFFSSLPLSAAAKRPFTDAFIPRGLLASTGQLQGWLTGGLGRDLGESLNFFTVPSEPQDKRRIELGFTTTKVRVDEAEEAAMLALINRERTQRGLHPLASNPAARAVARNYSRRMLAEGVFSHIDNDGHTPFDRMKAGGVDYAAAGENLALAPTLQQAHQGLMNSPGHRANILSPIYRTVGIGVIDAGPYGLMITQNFTD